MVADRSILSCNDRFVSFAVHTYDGPSDPPEFGGFWGSTVS